MANIYKKLLVLFIFIFYLSCYYSTIYITFRNDDISYKSDPIFEYQILQIFRKYNIKPLYSIIPALGDTILNKDMPIADSLISWYNKGWIDIALHGYNHKYQFASLPYQEQYKRIRDGIHILENIFVDPPIIFVPPWNSANKNTIKALKANSLYGFSGYLGAPDIKNMIYINCNCNLINGPLGLFKDKLNIALQSNKDILLVPLFHTNYDFTNYNINELDSLLNYINKYRNKIQTISFFELMFHKEYKLLLYNNNKAGYIIKLFNNNYIYKYIFINCSLVNNIINYLYIIYYKGYYFILIYIINIFILHYIYILFYFIL